MRINYISLTHYFTRLHLGPAKFSAKWSGTDQPSAIGVTVVALYYVILFRISRRFTPMTKRRSRQTFERWGARAHGHSADGSISAHIMGRSIARAIKCHQACSYLSHTHSRIGLPRTHMIYMDSVHASVCVCGCPGNAAKSQKSDSENRCRSHRSNASRWRAKRILHAERTVIYDRSLPGSSNNCIARLVGNQ